MSELLEELLLIKLAEGTPFGLRKEASIFSGLLLSALCSRH